MSLTKLKDSTILTPSIVGSPFPILPLVFPISDYTGYATISTPVSHLKVPFKTRLFQLPTNVAEKAWEHGPRTWAPGTHVGMLSGMSGSWLWLGPALVVSLIWGVNQKKISLSLCCSLSHNKK